MRHIDNPSSANILPGDCIVATPTQRAALSIGPEDAGKVIVEKSTGRMYLATMTEGSKPLSANLAAELAAIGALPAVPTAKTAFANPAGGRITQTTADITMLSCSLAAGAMGKNGLLKAGIKILGQATASLKRARIYVDTTLMHDFAFGTSSCSDYEVIIQNTGALNAQITTRSHWALAGISSSISGDLTSIDFAANRVVSAVVTIAANTESVLIVPRYLNLQAKA
jgi:hypothetical protein